MIEVKDLTKYYGSFLAVDKVSFNVDEGEVVGILGPNGAGKTTLIRMLTCFMPANGGRATIDGHDVFTDSLAVRTSIGYMPENVPLYNDLRVGEYLDFHARLRGLNHDTRYKRVDEVLKQCQLTDRRRQLIGTLSKGYRQRVGLAQALVGDPKVLILDEPTIGLDPGQIREARALIQELGRRHTILFSSHILHEVEQVCSRVIMIASGQVVADGSLDELKSGLVGAAGVVLEARCDKPGDLEASLAKIRGVAGVEADKLEDGWARFEIRTDGKADIREWVGKAAVDGGWAIRVLRTTQPTLEEFFVQKVAEQNLRRPVGQTQAAQRA